MLCREELRKTGDNARLDSSPLHVAVARNLPDYATMLIYSGGSPIHVFYVHHTKAYRIVQYDYHIYVTVKIAMR